MCNRLLMLTALGLGSVTFTYVMYALSQLRRRYVLLFALGSLTSAAYGVLAQAWAFSFVELACATVAGFHGRRPMVSRPLSQDDQDERTREY